ncbi:alpha-galactosidase [candidate division KSB1 bacterium]|nr:alpha-galactosidase [candidate division KSB1 bacterium]
MFKKTIRLILVCFIGAAGAIEPTPAEMTAAADWMKRYFDGTAAVPFSFIFDGTDSDVLMSRWQRTGRTRRIDSNQSLQSFVFTDSQSGLRIRAEATIYDDYPAVEWLLYLKNTGKSEAPILENNLPMDIRLPVATMHPVLHYARGALCCIDDFEPMVKVMEVDSDLRLQPGGGRSSSEYLPFFNIDFGGHGMVAAIGWTGEWMAAFNRPDEQHVQIQAGIALTHLRLKPGEEIRTPRILLLFWQDSSRLPESSQWLRGNNLLRRFILTHHRPQPGGKPLQLPVILSSWGGWKAAEHLAGVQRLTDHDLDVDLYWIDADWFGQGDWWFQAGDWRVKKDLYPDGFKPITDLLHQHGREFLLWFELFRVCKITPWYQLRNNAGWLLELNDGIEKYQQWRSGTKWPVPHEDPRWIEYESHRSQMTEGEMLYNIGNVKARQFLTQFLGRKIKEFGLDWYREDANIAPVEYWREADAWDRQGMTEIRYIEGLYAFWDDLLRQFPNLKIDNCASGGRRIDLETIGRSTVLHRTDWARDAIHAQCHSYGLFHWLPLHMAGRGAALTRGNEYEIRSVMTAGLNVGLWDEKDGDGTEEFKRLLQQYRSVQKYFYGDYYPLTPYSQKTTDWIGWQFDLPESNAGLVQAFRRQESVYTTASLRLFNLASDQTYLIKNIDTGEHYEANGNALMTEGLAVSIAASPGSALLEYRLK